MQTFHIQSVDLLLEYVSTNVYCITVSPLHIKRGLKEKRKKKLTKQINIFNIVDTFFENWRQVKYHLS